jgi:hypothetical protein
VWVAEKVLMLCFYCCGCSGFATVVLAVIEAFSATVGLFSVVGGPGGI